MTETDVKKCSHRYYETWRAKAALFGVMFNERLANRVGVFAAEAFNGLHFLAFASNGQCRRGRFWLAIDKHSTGTATAVETNRFCTS